MHAHEFVPQTLKMHMQRKFIPTSKKAKQRGRLWSHFQKYLESTPELSESAWETIMEEDRETYEGTQAEDYSSDSTISTGTAGSDYESD